MKYKFDEKKLLGLFLYDYGHHKLYSEPFLKDGYVYASDAHKLIRIKADTLKVSINPQQITRCRWQTRIAIF